MDGDSKSEPLELAGALGERHTNPARRVGMPHHDELHRLAASGRQLEVAPGTVLFSEGEVGDRFYVVLEGELEVIKALGSTDETLLATRGAGETVGEMSLLGHDVLRTASVRTREQARLSEVTRADLDQALLRRPALAYDLARLLTRRLREADDAIIRHLREKNRVLIRANEDLKSTQAQLIEKERLEQELRVARQIQRTMLPGDVPHLGGWHIMAHYQPAREVGGDFYDFFSLPGGKLGLVIGDVTGKGVPAALVMATTLSVVRTVAGDYDSPGGVLERINRLLVPGMHRSMFVTCLYATLELETGRLTFANAGHDLPLWQNEGGVVELRASGMPLGLMGGMDYEDQQADLEVGDRVLFRSDGIVEAHNQVREMFGSERLRNILSDHPRADGDEVIPIILRSLQEFTGDQVEQEDDMTLVTLQRDRFIGGG